MSQAITTLVTFTPLDSLRGNMAIQIFVGDESIGSLIYRFGYCDFTREGFALRLDFEKFASIGYESQLSFFDDETTFTEMVAEAVEEAKGIKTEETRIHNLTEKSKELKESILNK